MNMYSLFIKGGGECNMPRFDGTGPAGAGPMTGLCCGPCAFRMGRQKGFGSRRGLGRYYGWDIPQIKKDKQEVLSNYRKALEEELEDVIKEEAKLNKKE